MLQILRPIDPATGLCGGPTKSHTSVGNRPPFVVLIINPYDHNYLAGDFVTMVGSSPANSRFDEVPSLTAYS